MSRFHDLTVTGIDRQTPESVAVSLDVPPELKDDFQYQPGQYLTLAATIGGEDIRRSYSICSAPGDEVLKVGVKKVEDGAFSSFVNDGLAIGDKIRVMPPEGRFTPELGSDHHYLLIAAGSGITPMLSIAKTVLNSEQGSQITLVYGNKSTETIMFREELDDLKDRHMGRFALVHVLSRETQDIDLLQGRIDGERIIALTEKGLIDPKGADLTFICGPGEMIDSVSAAVMGMGVPGKQIRYERFTIDGEMVPPKGPSKEAREVAEKGVTVEVMLDGMRRDFKISDPEKTVLSAGQDAGLDLPFSCAGGMCCTCRCRIVEGSGEMAVNYSLQPWEIEAGFTLACQTRPTSEKLVLDFDAA
ncbi:MAG: 1,2-phenylacetyl-CoA epoxidase subunit PaaE [Rhizobiaceae bacterium]